jgi:hypothetical protein
VVVVSFGFGAENRGFACGGRGKDWIMTARKRHAKVIIGSYVDRRHFAVRMREDLLLALRNRCIALNCSQGVYLEILLSKALLRDLVKASEVYEYDPAQRSLQKLLWQLQHDPKNTYTPVLRKDRPALIRKLSRMLVGFKKKGGMR